MGAVQSTVIDGVPVLFASCPGPTVGTLLFRVGVGDESLLTRGITHLIEHLALSGFDQRVVAFNGSVGPTFTTFVARGTPEEVCRHLTAVAGALVQLPAERAAHEARILRAEAAQRSRSLMGHASMLRYGAAGFGLIEYEELFLQRPDHGAIAAHLRTFFTKANAVVVLSTPPTADLRFDTLPGGTRQPVAPVASLPLRFPAWDRTQARMVGLSTVLPRSPVVPVATWVIAEHLRAELRERYGLSYDAGSTYEPWSAGEAHHLVYADCQPKDATLVAEQLHTELSRIVIGGVRTDDLDAFRTLVRRSDAEPMADYGWAQQLATDHLLGRALQSREQDMAELNAVTPADVEALVDRVRASALWLVPDHVRLADHRLSIVPQWTEPLAGTQYAAIDPRRGVVAHVSDGGVSLHFGDDRWVSVPFTRLAACKRWSDGGRSYFRADGFVANFEPGIWMASAELVEHLDRVTPADRVVDTPDPMLA